jgi:hypothetical protein
MVPELAARLGDDWDRLEAVRTPFGAETAGTVSLLAAWQAHVDRYRVEASKSAADPTAWHGGDLLAGLYLRDFLQECLDQMPEALSRRVLAVVEDVDAEFRAITRVDDEQLIKAYDLDVDPASRGWWWRRIPTTGAIHEDLVAGGM